MVESYALLFWLSLAAFLAAALWILSTFPFYWLLLASLQRISPRDVTTLSGAVDHPKASIIVPVFNEGHRMRQKLVELLQLKYPAHRLEIIIVDDGSTDDSPEIVESMSSEMGNRRVVLLRREHGGPAAALKVGTDLADGDLIVWTDADATAEPDSLEKAVSLFANGRVGAVFGRTMARIHAPGVAERHRELLARDSLRSLESHAGSAFYSNANFLVFRAGYASRIRPDAVLYDAQLVAEVIADGRRAIFVPEIVAYHPEPQKMRTYLRRRRRNFQGLLQLTQMEFPRFLLRKVSFRDRAIAFRSFVLYPLLPLAVVGALVSLVMLFLLIPALAALIILAALAGMAAILWLGSKRASEADSHVSGWTETWREVLAHLWALPAYGTHLASQRGSKGVQYSPGRD